MKHRRRRLIVLYSVLAALLVGFAAFAYVQRSNLRALVMSLRYSEDELLTLQEQSASDLLEQLGLTADPITQSGVDTNASSVSPSESIAAPPEEHDDTFPHPDSTEPSDIVQSTGSDETEAKSEQKPDGEALPKDVQNLVYSLYSLQSQYSGKIDGIRASTLAQFNALPPEKKTASNRLSIVKSGVSQALSLEKQCDGRVASIVRELRAALKKNGLDDSLADRAENYYATQKGLVKAEYMRKYNKYLK